MKDGEMQEIGELKINLILRKLLLWNTVAAK
jgi:hypothetical protein